MYLIIKVVLALVIAQSPARCSKQDQQDKHGVQVPFGIPWYPANINVINYNVTHQDNRYNLMTSTVELELQLAFNKGALLPFTKIGFLRSEQLVPCDKVDLVNRARENSLDCLPPSRHVVDKNPKGPTSDAAEYDANTKYVRRQVIHAKDERLPVTFDRLVIYPLKRSEIDENLQMALERLNMTDELHFETRPRDFGYYFEADVQFGGSKTHKCHGDIYIKVNDYGKPAYFMTKIPPFVQDIATLLPNSLRDATLITGDRIQCEHPLEAGSTMETNFTLVIQGSHPYYIWKHSTRSIPKQELLQIDSSYWEHFDLKQKLFLADFNMNANSATNYGSVDLVGSWALGGLHDNMWISMSMPGANLNVSYVWRLVKNQKPPLYHSSMEVFDTESSEEDIVEPVLRIDKQQHLRVNDAVVFTKITPEIKKRLMGYENWFKIFDVDLENVKPMERQFSKMPVINIHDEL